MTSLMGAKKRAEEFAAVVDGGADAARLHPELRELVGVVNGLRAERRAEPAPHPAFTASLRERLMAEAATSLTADNILTLPPRRKGSRERRLALVASSLVLVGGTAGMAAAAQSALPGEALYPIKRGIEQAQAGLATDPATKGKDLLDAADSRLVEVQGLFDSSADLSQVPGTLDDFSAQALEATALLLDEYEQTGDPSLIAQLHAFASANLDELQELAKTASPEHQDELAMAADILLQIDQKAQAACPTCDSLDTLSMPPLFLTAVDARAAMDAVERVQLYNAHPTITTEEPPRSRHDGPKKAKHGSDDTSDGPQGTQGTDDQTTDDPSGTGTDETGGSDDTGSGTGLPELPSGLNGSTGSTKTGGGSGGTSGGGGGGDTPSTTDEVEDALPDALEPVVKTLLP
jgi:hypothetical protein